jgi:hypothetical protein
VDGLRLAKAGVFFHKMPHLDTAHHVHLILAYTKLKEAGGEEAMARSKEEEHGSTRRRRRRERPLLCSPSLTYLPPSLVCSLSPSAPSILPSLGGHSPVFQLGDTPQYAVGLQNVEKDLVFFLRTVHDVDGFRLTQPSVLFHIVSDL